jgi:pilus assembly protein CpaB
MGRTRGCIWLAAGIIVALLAGVVGYIAISRSAARVEPGAGQTGRGASVQAVTAAQAIPLRSVLTAEMLVVKDISVEAVPEGYVAEVDDAVGKLNLTDLAPGEILIAGRLLEPDVTAADGRLALLMTDDQVLMAFPATDLMNGLGILKPGDHVDLLFSMPFTDRTGGVVGDVEELVTFKALENQVIAAIVGGQADENGNASQAKALLLTVAPEDAITLKYLKDAGAIMDVVLRAPGAEQPMDVEPMDVDRLMNEYRIPAAVGR